MIWIVAALPRVVVGVIRDEVAVRRLQRSQAKLRDEIPGYSNAEVDRAFRHAEYMQRRLAR